MIGFDADQFDAHDILKRQKVGFMKVFEGRQVRSQVSIQFAEAFEASVANLYSAAKSLLQDTS